MNLSSLETILTPSLNLDFTLVVMTGYGVWQPNLQQWFLNRCEFLKTTPTKSISRLSVLSFAFQSITQNPKHARKWPIFSQGYYNLEIDKTIQQIQKQ